MIRLKNGQWNQYKIYKNHYSILYYNYNNTTLWSNTETDAQEYIPFNYPDDLNNIRINVRATNNQLMINAVQPLPTVHRNTLIEYIHTTTKWQQPLVANSQMSGSNEHLTMDSCIYTICSDGGVRNSEAGVGIITVANGQIIIRNKVRIPSTFNDINSYRAEAFGIATTATTYYLIQQYKKLHNLPQKANCLRIICDSKSVIDKINSIRNVWGMTTKYFTSPDSDILTAIAVIIQKIRKNYGKVELIHVKGHQDRNNNKELSEDALLNIEADHLATASLAIRVVPKIDIGTISAELYINDKLVSAKRTQLIKKTFHSMSLRDYLKTSNNWSDKIIDDIWFIITGPTLNKFSKYNATTLQKFIYKRLPCNTKEHRYYPYKSEFCSQCKTQKETSYHVLQCGSCISRFQEREKFIKTLKHTLQDLRTDESVIRVLIAYISAWLHQTLPPNLEEIVTDPSQVLIDAIQAQHQIGWDNLFKGRLSIQWATMYNFVINNTDHGLKFPTAEKWGSKILEIIWQFVLNCWTIRNNIEHDSDGDPERMKKLKLGEKLIWHKDKLKTEHKIEIYTDMHIDKLLNMPMANLQIMERQLESLYKTKQIEKHKKIRKTQESNNVEHGMPLQARQARSIISPQEAGFLLESHDIFGNSLKIELFYLLIVKVRHVHT
jgi:RNase H